MIHAARIINVDGGFCDTKPGQVFEFLDRDMAWGQEDGKEIQASCWWSGRYLDRTCDTTAISTRISEIRARLPGGRLYVKSSRLERYEIQVDRREGGWYYRLVRRMGKDEQIDLFRGHDG